MRSSVGTALHRRGYLVFQRLPKKLRKHLVRAVTPNYTLGAVVLLRDEDGRLLLLRQPGREEWSLPGGLLNRLEEPIQGAARELAEETGVRLDVSALRPAYPSALVNPRTQQVDCVFEATAPAGAQVEVDMAEAVEFTWAAQGHFPSLTRPTRNLLGVYGLVVPAAAGTTTKG